LKHELLIIGAGAAGIMAAITAKDLGVDVAILEANDRIAKKILATGNGRCNITNSYTSADRYHSDNSDFFIQVLNFFDVNSTKNFFSGLGLNFIQLEEGKLYPMSLQSSSVLDILRLTLDEKSIPIYTNTKVKDILVIKNSFKLTTNSDDIYICDKLILATGGSSAPKTGSDGNGFVLAKRLGHNVIPPIPALVQLKLDYKGLKALSGVKFDGMVSVYSENKCLRKELGEILFTDYGISGPPILQVSRIASYELSKHKNVTIHLDLFPSMKESDLVEFLENHFGTFSYRSVHDSLIGIINKKLIPILLSINLARI
jgi:predicted Rossmann fold flavoprotein